ncbi:MAG: Tfp pilus assembly protein PilE [Pseudohongiellaceae bacterium]|jgi:Tfp pilus assembly protein PilE
MSSRGLSTVHRQQQQRGFSAIQVVVTVAILIALAGVLIPSMNTYLNKNHRSLAKEQMDKVAEVFSRYKADTRDWPTPYDQLPIKTGNHRFSTYFGFYRNTTKSAGWDGPYFDEGVVVNGKMRVSNFDKGTYEGMIDPWGRQYRVFTYRHGYSGTLGGIMLVSYGFDGKLSTNASSVFAGDAMGDDLVQLITYSLD